jgi:hypothetical protein
MFNNPIPVTYFGESGNIPFVPFPPLPTGSLAGYWDTYFPQSFATASDNANVTNQWFDLSGNQYTASIGGVTFKAIYDTNYRDSQGLVRGPAIFFENTSEACYWQVTGSFKNQFPSGNNPQMTILMYYVDRGTPFAGTATPLYAYNKISFQTTPGGTPVLRANTNYSDATTSTITLATRPGNIWGLAIYRSSPTGSSSQSNFKWSGSYALTAYSGSGTITSASFTTDAAGNDNFRIGSFDEGKVTPPYRIGFYGNIQAVAVYTSSLTDEEISNAYQYFTRRPMTI